MKSVSIFFTACWMLAAVAGCGQDGLATLDQGLTSVAPDEAGADRSATYDPLCYDASPTCSGCMGDLDGDGYVGIGVNKRETFHLPASQRLTCPDGWVAGRGDCDDGRAWVHPGRLEIAKNGRDDNCNGAVDEYEYWCSEFYAWCADHGLAGIGSKDSVSDLENYFGPDYLFSVIRFSDLFGAELADWLRLGAGKHTGMFLALDTTHVWTIEGNAYNEELGLSHAVSIRRRSYSSLGSPTMATSPRATWTEVPSWSIYFPSEETEMSNPAFLPFAVTATAQRPSGRTTLLP